MPSRSSSARTGGAASARVEASSRASVSSRNTLPTVGSSTPTTSSNPQTGTPPQISGVAAIEISTTGAIVVWNLDQPASGQVFYGATTAYGSTTTLESSFTLNQHAQAVSGLTANTTYHYKVRSVNAAGQATESADGTFTTLAAAGTTPQPAALRYVPMNSDAMPSYLGTIVDSTWGTTIRRITNVDLRRNRYGTDQPWSKDGNWLYLAGTTGSALRRMVHGTTYADIGQVTNASQYFIWSNVQNAIMYGIFNSGPSIHKLDPSVSISTQTLVGSFFASGASRRADQPADWTYIDSGGVWNISADDHLVGFWATRSNGSWDAVAYDPVDDRIEATMNITNAVPTAVVVSLSGTYIIVDQSSISARKVYTMTPRVGTTPGSFTFVRDISIAGGSHGLPGVDHGGNDIWIRSAGYGDVIRLDTGATTNLVPANTCVAGGHAGYAIGRPGYVYWSVDYVGSTAKETEKGYGQLICTPTGSGALPNVEVYGCHHNMVTTAATATAGYSRRLFANPNRDGTKVLFGSDWHGSVAYSGSTYAFVAGVSA